MTIIKTGRKHSLSTNPQTENETIEDPPKKRVRWRSNTDAEDEAESDNSGDSVTAPEEESATFDSTCLAITRQNGRIGGAYFDPVKLLVYILEDILEGSHLDLTTMLIEQVDPNTILTSSKADEDFLEALRKFMDVSGGTIQIRPQRDFTPRRGRDRLSSLSFLSELPVGPSELLAQDPDIVTNAYDFMRRRIDVKGDPTIKRWNASIRMANFASFDQSPLCLSSIGALLDHLTRQRAVGNLGDDGVGGLEIRGIETFTIDQVMHVNADALHSLQVFDQEDHASVHSDKPKEGLSLYGILDNTKTILGRDLLCQWLLRPSLSLSVINSRHDAIECFLRPDNLTTSDALHRHLTGIRNVPRILAALKSGKSKSHDWQSLVVFSFHAAMVRDSLCELNQSSNIEIVKKLINTLDVGMLREAGTAINDTIDWEESITSSRVCVRQHIDEELDNRKRIYAGIDTVLSKVAEQISATIPDKISSLNVVYFPQLGFLICTPMLEEWIDGSRIEVMDGWAYQFSSDDHVYFKSQEMHDMDTHIGDLHSSIVDREIEIVQALQERIMVYEQDMSLTCDFCAELDILLSFAEAARAYNFKRPQMNEGTILKIVQGRHPLQEMIVDVFVPNDTNMVGGASRSGLVDASSLDHGNKVSSIVVCTGANACGKSVYLKQVALIPYMAQVGCFVPAESATLGIVDKIFTRVQTRESVSKAQSAFMIDLNQVSFALRNCTERSLILLDEFGKGTVSTDGAGLFCGVIKHLANRGVSCPKVLVATHFHQVNSEILDSLELSISFVHMQVMFTTDVGQPLGPSTMVNNATGCGLRRDEKITYLYRVVDGLAKRSHAAKCAELCGLSRFIVERAQYVSDLVSGHNLGRLLDEEMNEEEQQDLQNAEAICRRFLAWNLPDLEGGMKTKLAEILERSDEKKDDN